jgi:hypothetical protein
MRLILHTTTAPMNGRESGDGKKAALNSILSNGAKPGGMFLGSGSVGSVMPTLIKPLISLSQMDISWRVLLRLSVRPCISQELS